ncbi:hypothetical protein [Aeoliella mucimassa]|uniref:LamG-like jellyroll fold domain-containing protein n=1 Tax=Aeoliella mucimassa TaxID=2527972 RepID=A0A518AUD1_9BACT|nr:hypothetical protein [Aeoliella mucimassa]QDU58330.1 hypothetical protein Pan181_45640 [Aeoliella mucimassa]
MRALLCTLCVLSASVGFANEYDDVAATALARADMIAVPPGATVIGDQPNIDDSDTIQWDGGLSFSGNTVLDWPQTFNDGLGFVLVRFKANTEQPEGWSSNIRCVLDMTTGGSQPVGIFLSVNPNGNNGIAKGNLVMWRRSDDQSSWITADLGPCTDGEFHTVMLGCAPDPEGGYGVFANHENEGLWYMTMGAPVPGLMEVGGDSSHVSRFFGGVISDVLVSRVIPPLETSNQLFDGPETFVGSFGEGGRQSGFPAWETSETRRTGGHRGAAVGPSKVGKTKGYRIQRGGRR